MSHAETQRHIRFLRSFTANEPAIRAYVRRMVPTRGDADDVMQEVSVVLWEKFDTLREDGNFRTWAFGVTRYEVSAWMRDKKGDRFELNQNVFAGLAEEARGAIEAPAEFHFESTQRLLMRRGRLAAETHALESGVIAKATGAGAGKTLRGRDAVTLHQGANDARELRSSAFIQTEELPGLPAGQRDRSVPAVVGTLKIHPALLALTDYESESAQHPGAFLTVLGRWPGSRATEFVNVGDHLKLDAGGGREWQQLTLAPWMRLDRLGTHYQSLLHTDGWSGNNAEPAHWMVTQHTTMRLAPGSDEPDGYPDSRNSVLPEQGRRLPLATVYDATAKTVRFFLNGRLEKESRQTIAHPARPGPAQIGNRDRTDRKLSGHADELFLPGHAMTDGEERGLFEAGNPYR